MNHPVAGNSRYDYTSPYLSVWIPYPLINHSPVTIRISTWTRRMWQSRTNKVRWAASRSNRRLSSCTSCREFKVRPHLLIYPSVPHPVVHSHYQNYGYMNFGGYHASGGATMNLNIHNQQGASGSSLVDSPYLPYYLFSNSHYFWPLSTLFRPRCTLWFRTETRRACSYMPTRDTIKNITW